MKRKRSSVNPSKTHKHLILGDGRNKYWSLLPPPSPSPASAKVSCHGGKAFLTKLIGLMEFNYLKFNEKWKKNILPGGLIFLKYIFVDDVLSFVLQTSKQSPAKGLNAFSKNTIITCIRKVKGSPSRGLTNSRNSLLMIVYHFY